MSFSIPTLQSFTFPIKITSGGNNPADPIMTSVGVSCVGSTSILNGFIATSTVGASLVYTLDGTSPVYGSNGTIIPCQTGYFVATTPANSCENQGVGCSICPSITTIKAIAYLGGLSSNVASTTACRTCPGSLTAPTITSSCPNGQGAFGCNGGQITFTISAGSQCGDLRYTVQEGSAPADPTITSNSITSGSSFTYSGTTNGMGIQVYVKAKLFDNPCSLTSTVTSYSFGYQYP